jgi:peptidyl-tRNA hydrolase
MKHYGKIIFATLSLLALPWFSALCHAEARCVNSDGEAGIVGNDLPSARAEAIGRAKWVAVEQVAGVEVKAQTMVQNLMTVDEAISKRITGSIKSYTILSQMAKDEVMTVQINACVESDKAKDTLAGLAMNNGISVFLLAKDITGKIKGYEESNILSETLIGKLVDHGYTVTDVAATRAVDDDVIHAAITSGKLLSLRGLIHRYLTNVMLIGKVDYTVSTRKGEAVGYGLSLPFNSVTARLSYRLISKNAGGEMIILAAGTEQGKGFANSVADAAAASLTNLSEKFAPSVLEKVANNLQSASKKVTIKVKGISELSENFAVKELLQNIAWVTHVEQRGLGEFAVSYPENPIYLANSISQKGFHVDSFTPLGINLKYLH